jgi:GTP-binding protein Era
MVKNEQILAKIAEFQKYQSRFRSLIPVSIKHGKSKTYLLNELEKFMPIHPFFYDQDALTTQMMKEIYSEYIREAVFKFTSDEVPYSTEVIIDKVEEKNSIDKICATIICEKEGQKNIIIGSGGDTLKRIGSYSRQIIEKIINKKILLLITVKSNKNWTKNEKILTKFGYL